MPIITTQIIPIVPSCVSYGGQVVSRLRTRNTSPRPLAKYLRPPASTLRTPTSAAGARRACGGDAVKLHKPSCSRFDD